MWSNKCDIVSLKNKHETRWSLGLTGIGMDFIRFWEAEPEIGRDSLDVKIKRVGFPMLLHASQVSLTGNSYLVLDYKGSIWIEFIFTETEN